MSDPQPVTQEPKTGYLTEQQQQLYSPVRTDKIVASRGFYITKIVLGTSVLASCIVVLGLAGGLVSMDHYINWSYLTVFCFPVAAVSALWQLAEFITLCVRKDRGIHPGAHVGLHLLLWLGSAAAVGFISTSLYFGDYDDDDYYYSYSRRRRALGVMPLMRALDAFMAILLLLHFTLFVRACVECNRRNRAPPAVMLMPAAYLAGGQMPPHMSYMPQPPNSAYFPVQPQQAQQPYYGTHTSYYAPAPAQQQGQPVQHTASSPPPPQQEYQEQQQHQYQQQHQQQQQHQPVGSAV